MRNQSRQDGMYRRASISLNRNNITTYAGYRSTWQDNNLSSNLHFFLSLLHTRKESKCLVSMDEIYRKYHIQDTKTPTFHPKILGKTTHDNVTQRNRRVGLTCRPGTLPTSATGAAPSRWLSPATGWRPQSTSRWLPTRHTGWIGHSWPGPLPGPPTGS